MPKVLELLHCIPAWKSCSRFLHIIIYRLTQECTGKLKKADRTQLLYFMFNFSFHSVVPILPHISGVALNVFLQPTIILGGFSP